MRLLIKTLPIDYLHERLIADFDAGRLYWREHEAMPQKWNTRYAGTEAFTADNGKGYRRGAIDSKNYLAHRILYAMNFGEWPHHIDHINGDTSDNRICNLRSVDHQENTKNQRRRKRNTSGHTGVGWHKRIGKWMARITVDGKDVHLGYFERLEDAIHARKAAEITYGYHQNHGRD